MDDMDRAILAALQADARVSLATLARRLKVARSTVQARIERLESSGTIAGYTVRLGAAARAARVRASVLLTIDPRAQAGVLARLKALPEVEAVHTTSGRFDLLAQIAAESTAALDRALDRIGEIEGVRGSETLIHLSTRFDRAG
jgi:DNA-binding Lrp family transcriptional regulator